MPEQSEPISRDRPEAGYLIGPGLAAAQDPCMNLPGLAQQMCYAALYGVSE